MALLATALVSCGDDEKPFWDGRPVDGPYYVTLQQLKNECYGMEPDEDTVIIVDMFLRDDGLHDLRHNSFWLPGPMNVEAVTRDGGNIDHTYAWTTYDDERRDLKIKGIVTPDIMELTFTYRGADDCREKVRLAGTPRPLTDPTALDGTYVLDMRSWGEACGTETHQASEPWKNLHYIYQIPSQRLWMVMDGGFYFSPDPPGDDGTVDWQGDIYLPMGFFDLEFEASLTGNLTTLDVDLALEHWPYGETSDSTDCTSLYTMEGVKQIPSLDQVDNIYRGRFRVTDGCAEAGEEGSWDLHSTIRLTTLDATTVRATDPAGPVNLTFDGMNLSADLGDPSSGYTITYRGRVDPPHLDYSIDYVVYEQGVEKCALNARLTGAHARYVFE